MAGGDGLCGLQQLEVALAEPLAWVRLAPPLDFPIACDLFQAATARQVFYGGHHGLLTRQRRKGPLQGELPSCRATVNEALAITTGYSRDIRTARVLMDQPVLGFERPPFLPTNGNQSP